MLNSPRRSCDPSDRTQIDLPAAVSNGDIARNFQHGTPPASPVIINPLPLLTETQLSLTAYTSMQHAAVNDNIFPMKSPDASSCLGASLHI